MPRARTARPRGSPRAPLRCTARAWRTATWRCSTAPITRRGPWKRRFCARRYRMRCTAACRSSAAARSRTRCRTCASSPTRTTSTSRMRPSATWVPGAWRFCARRPTSWDAACSRRSSASWTTICSSARRRASCCSWSTASARRTRAGRCPRFWRPCCRKAATSARCAPRAARSGSTTWPS